MRLNMAAKAGEALGARAIATGRHRHITRRARKLERTPGPATGLPGATSGGLDFKGLDAARGAPSATTGYADLELGRPPSRRAADSRVPVANAPPGPTLRRLELVDSRQVK